MKKVNSLKVMLVLGMVSVLSASCGKKASNGEINQMVDALGSVGKSSDASSKKSAQNLRNGIVIGAASAHSSSGSLNDAWDSCVAESNASSDYSYGGSHSSVSGMNFRVSNERCPIEFSLATSPITQETKTFTMEISFKAKTAEAKRIYDVDSLSWKIEIKAEDENHGTMGFVIDGHSQKYGKITMALKGKLEEGQKELVLEGPLTTGEKSGELKIVAKGEGDVEYFIDGEKLTEEQARKAFKALDTSGAQGSNQAIF